MVDAKSQKALDFIARCDSPKALRQMALNAAGERNLEVQKAAKLRLYAILPSEEPGTLEYDVWQSVHALEDTLTDERGKTVRLSRTRQKITRDREQKTVSDLILGKQSQGFDLLLERGLARLTFEAVSLRHQGRFSEDVLTAAEKRLSASGVDPKKLS